MSARLHGEGQRVLRSVTEVETLLLCLALLNFLAQPVIARPALYLGVTLLYGASVLALRNSRRFAGFPRHRLMAATTGMVLFITVMLALSGGGQGAALGLYLLPVITAALTLGKRATVAQLALILVARLALAVHVDGTNVFALQYGLSMVTETVPMLLVALLTTSLASDVHIARERLQVKSSEDDLTGLLNMGTLTRRLQDEQQRATARGGSYALLLVDVDGLKTVNDRYGHEAGNRALKAVAHSLRRSCRSVDLLARYGGDEFLVLLSGAGPAIAKVVANRIRHNVFATTLQFGGALHRVSVGVGIAVFADDGRHVHDLVAAAGRSLARDKENRRPLAQEEASVPARRTG
jgi:diguanylate cyclase (GGDEF)-like protein